VGISWNGRAARPAGRECPVTGRGRPDGDGDTYGVVIRIELDSGLTLATSTMYAEDLVTRSEGPDARGILAAAEVLAKLQYETEKVLRDYQAARSDTAEQLAGQALAELESGASPVPAATRSANSPTSTSAYTGRTEAGSGANCRSRLGACREDRHENQ
jgi:hypothetical protein